jgi:hypothetical protein
MSKIARPRSALKGIPSANVSIGSQDRKGSDKMRCEFSNTRWLLQRRLAWYGLRSVSVGSLRDLTDKTVLADLRRANGILICRIQVDRENAMLGAPAGRVLSRLLSVAA